MKREIRMKENEVKNTKSAAKAAGLKSVFRLGDDLIMTSFGRGNEAVVEKRISGSVITELSKKPAYKVTAREKQFEITGRVKGQTDDPNYSKKRAGMDVIRCKSRLEKRFFGKTFEDNIHIQLIYNILDIEKILSVHINNIVYAIDNLRRADFAEYDDFIGYMSLRNSYRAFLDPDTYIGDWKIANNVKKSCEEFKKLINNKRLAYFGSAFFETGSDKKASMGKSVRKSDEDIYYMIALIGEIRQMLAHSSGQTRAALYNLDDPKYKDALSMLSRLYKKRIDSLNSDFIKNAKKDLTILIDILGGDTYEAKSTIAADFYDFTVRKNYKNLGFSIKTLRELILQTDDAHFLTGASYDSVRSKLYKLLDFIIFTHYKSNPALIEENIASLRSFSTEQQKLDFYAKEAQRLWKEIKSMVIDKLVPKMKGNFIAKLEPDADITPDMIKSSLISSDADSFTKAVYMITLLLDGKEINDLLTTLINKFENIDSFVCVLKELGLEHSFVKEYAMFSRSAVIAQELRCVNSFARMSTPDPSAKLEMFVEAAQVLGTDDTEEQLREYFSQVLDKQQGAKKKNGKKDNGLRNFIASNVIESSRFKYLIRYNNAAKTRKLASNRKVVEFALSEIPALQIERYVKSCCLRTDGTEQDGRRALADIITGISFSDFENVRQDDRSSNADEKKDKARLQAIISLYLTVLYLITKNLVYVNTRYFLAFHCFERDIELYTGQEQDFRKIPHKTLTAAFIKDTEYSNRHSRKYLEHNIACSDSWAVKAFRNNAAHLGAVRNADRYIGDIACVDSWFALYHYLNQRALIQQFDFDLSRGYITKDKVNPRLHSYFDAVKSYKTYCKDFVKALNVPFGYNLARYKNLSIDGLFDRNRPGSGKEHMEVE